MNPKEAREYLYRLRHGGSRYGRPRMWRMLADLGHPQWKVATIHVGGTNGKGSVCALLEAALRRAGFRTGLFTSPHLIWQGERIQVNREILPDAVIAEYTVELKERCGRLFPEGDPLGTLSFFEFMTVMAFLHFERAGVDIALIEVGLGGRLDSTNVLRPLACAITSIGLDHQDILGSGITDIAEEKAGILKPGVPAVLGPVPELAAGVFRRVAMARRIPLYEVERLVSQGVIPLPESGLAGEHQRWNAAVALGTLSFLPAPFDRALSGAREAFRTVRWEGRWQRLEGGNVPIWVDAAHNEAGVRMLDRLLEENPGSPWTILIGTTGESRARAFLPLLLRHAERVVLLQPEHPRATTFEEWEGWLEEADYGGPVHRGRLSDLFPKPATCSISGQASRILVTGSLYLIGDVLDRWVHDPPLAQNALQD